MLFLWKSEECKENNGYNIPEVFALRYLKISAISKKRIISLQCFNLLEDHEYYQTFKLVKQNTYTVVDSISLPHLQN